MDLMDFYERQQQDFERFKVLRDKAWQQILVDNENLAAAYGGKENLSPDAAKSYHERINNFNAEWSMDGGSKYKDLLDQHDKQLRQITGNHDKDGRPGKENGVPRKEKSENTTKERFQNQSESMTDKDQQTDSRNEDAEREQLREKIARQQAAIKARKMQKKRSR
jgi:hypothetical protein